MKKKGCKFFLISNKPHCRCFTINNTEARRVAEPRQKNGGGLEESRDQRKKKAGVFFLVLKMLFKGKRRAPNRTPQSPRTKRKKGVGIENKHRERRKKKKNWGRWCQDDAWSMVF
jgi:hypothetical protein